MADRPNRRRRRLMLLVWTLAVALATWAAWAVRSRLAGRPTPDRGWQALPPAPAPPLPPAADEPPAPPAPTAKPAAPRTATPAPPQAPRPSPTRRTTEPARTRAVPTAATLPSVNADARPEGPFGPGSMPARADGSSPHPDYTIKGKTAARIFHTPSGPYYTRVRADVWFRSADHARAAGFTERAARPRR